MRFLKLALKLVIVLIVTLVALELALIIFNPLGISYYRDTHAMEWESRIPDATGYTFIPNKTLPLYNWSYTTDSEGRRIVPQRVTSGTPVKFYGDSVTFCHGVNDDECWVSLVTEALGLNAVNYGRGSFAASNVDMLIEATAGESCIVFLTMFNDAEVMGQ